MNYGQAIELVKSGQRVARAGWNGRNMCVYLGQGATKALQSEREPLIGGVRSDLFAYDPTSYVGAHTMPHLIMRAADGSAVIGWLASQTDTLAEDWEIAK